MNKLSLKSQLILSLLLSGLIPAVLIGLYAYKQSSSALEDEIKRKLISVREAKTFELEKFMSLIKGQVRDLAAGALTKSAYKELSKGYEVYAQEIESSNASIAKEELDNYYRENLVTRFNKANTHQLDVSTVTSALPPTSLLLQRAYISSNPNKDGEKLNLDKADDSSYSIAHRKYHHDYSNFLKEYDYYDIFIVDAKTNIVIYSVFKEADFGADLTKGELSHSMLAKAYQVGVKDPGRAHLTEMDRYWPSLDDPAQFVSKAIVIDQEVVGVLIFQIPVQKLNVSLTGEFGWEEQGYGMTGENFLIGSDMVLRSISRKFYEDKANFPAQLEATGVTKDLTDYIKGHETTALAFKLNAPRLKESINSADKTITTYTTPFGEEVLAAVQKLKIDDVEWFLVSQMNVEEAFSSVKSLRNIVFLIVIGAMILIFIGAYFLAMAISNRIIRISNSLKQGSGNLYQCSVQIAEGASELSSTTDELAASVQETSSSVNEISSMITRSSESAGNVSAQSNQSREKARGGKDAVQGVRQIIELIHERNQNIASVVGDNNNQIETINSVIQEIAQKTNVINDIVFQTKLLSFNASVEAARAGEHGKGFAVVAEEVGSLAEMSGKAAAEIAQLIEKSTSTVSSIVVSSKKQMEEALFEAKKSVEEGVSKSVECEDILNEVLINFESVNNSVKDIASSATEQATGVQQITQAIHEIDLATQRNSGLAGESSARAEELKGQSESLAVIASDMERIVYGGEKTQ